MIVKLSKSQTAKKKTFAQKNVRGDVACDSFLSIFTASLNADSISDKALVKILPIKGK